MFMTKLLRSLKIDGITLDNPHCTCVHDLGMIKNLNKRCDKYVESQSPAQTESVAVIADGEVAEEATEEAEADSSSSTGQSISPISPSQGTVSSSPSAPQPEEAPTASSPDKCANNVITFFFCESHRSSS